MVDQMMVLVQRLETEVFIRAGFQPLFFLWLFNLGRCPRLG
jgi:hypothetical protein